MLNVCKCVVIYNTKIFLKNIIKIKIEKLQVLKKICFLIILNDVKKIVFLKTILHL